jgi:hypothetical protein
MRKKHNVCGRNGSEALAHRIGELKCDVGRLRLSVLDLRTEIRQVRDGLSELSDGLHRAEIWALGLYAAGVGAMLYVMANGFGWLK